MEIMPKNNVFMFFYVEKVPYDSLKKLSNKLSKMHF